MRRLLALMKKADPRIVDSWPTIQSKIKILHLSPGEWIKEPIGDKSWMFVEEGFLLLMGLQNGNWVCENFLWEGRSKIASTICGPNDFDEFGTGFQAVEQSTIYHISPEDVEYLTEVCMGFFWAKKAIDHRSWKFYGKVINIFEVDPPLSIQIVQRHFTVFLRAPESDLADFLGLASEKERMLLSAVRRKNEAARTYESSKT
jgi:hypothetical protein